MDKSKIRHNLPPMDPKETIKNNIIRKKPILDRDPQFFNNIPLPSWIELSLIDNCNRSCSFCPKSDENIAPNTNQKMERVLIDKLYNDLKEIDYQGAFCLCGYGEPLLYKDLKYVTDKLGMLGGIEVVTNGDTLLNTKKLLELNQLNVSRVLISLYDGPEQVQKFKELIKNTNIPEDFIILRDRWYGDDVDYGVKLTNRVGTVSVGSQPEINDFLKRKCFYTSYQVIIDWDGNVYLCPQDWQRRFSMGNIMQKKFFDIWNGKILSSYRKKHLAGDRNINPCNKCNADGQIYGSKHAKAWIK
jgi:radical SAM protein with 4Fe4S-binding SPASM domain